MDALSSNYIRKREQALRISRAALGIEVPPAEAPVWSVLMEWVAPSAVATCVTTLDGSADLLFSEGSELPGDHAPGAEPLVRAVAMLHEHANGLRQLLKPADAFPLPKAEHVNFFLLTDAGVLSASAREAELRIRRHPLWRLYFAAHEVTSALYQLDELRYSERA